MKKLFTSNIVLAVTVFCALVTSAQTRDRTLMWPPVPVGQIKAAADGIKLSSVNEAVQISDITVAGQSVIPGQTFATDDDWLRTLTVRLKNVSGQTIVAARIGFGLPETRTGDRQVGFSLEYGEMGTGGIAPDGRTIVHPDEEFELKFDEAQYRKSLAFFARQAGTASFTRVWIGVTTIKFEDGTIWGSGCLPAINPRASCPARPK